MNSSISERLIRCFSAVFDQVNEKDIPLLSCDTYDGWDSLSNIMLLSIIQQEFSVSLSPEEAKELTSFDGVLSRINNYESDHK